MHSNLITLSDSFAVLGNLYESHDKATTNILKVHKSMCTQRNRPKTPKKHSVLLMGDSHIRVTVERLAIKFISSFCAIGYVKSKADIQYYIVSGMRDQELK